MCDEYGCIVIKDNSIKQLQIIMDKHRTVVLLLVVLTVCGVTVAHVALTFPPARKYDLDFLDNGRTKGPCGMPKGK